MRQSARAGRRVRSGEPARQHHVDASNPTSQVAQRQSHPNLSRPFDLWDAQTPSRFHLPISRLEPYQMEKDHEASRTAIWTHPSSPWPSKRTPSCVVFVSMAWGVSIELGECRRPCDSD